MASLKFVLVHGTAEATEYLKQHCLKYVCSHVQLSERLMSNRIFRKLGSILM
ncbi:hypothetical protein RchiOBHm_Chr1g0379331 [Rosa chinensis]|uniref:Uncharacterized protein n=1 Tax=Rosa chinensis TaxID=74649 RepID=A0A2P6SNL7_ROSCH|nr:hypothetical protein RchiOBHm_Chr1g0379331 [Rosa chinensis]